MLHELTEDDPDIRMEYCETITNIIAHNQDYLRLICFSDEARFSVNGHVHRQNVRYWFDENLRIFREGHTQFPQKLNVWAGILGNYMVGPIFFDGNLNGDNYLNMLETEITAAINNIITNHRHEFPQHLIFQQDGASPHYAVRVRNYLNTVFPGRLMDDGDISSGHLDHRT